jgi:serine/threonine-protein kinase/endoribonuclease IRE1
MGLVTPTPPVPPRQPFLRRSALFFLFLFLSLAHAVSSQAANDAPAAGSLQAAPNAPAPFGAPQRIDHVPASIRDYRFNAPSALSPTHTDEPEETVTRGYGDPTIEELKLSPIALVVTVDGHVHALKRETGQWMWTLHDDGGVALGGTVTEEGKAKRKGAGAAVGGPLVSGMGRRRASTAAAGSFGSSAGRAASSSANETGLLEQEEEEEEVYVIEPHSQGDIYVYTRDGAGGSLEKLPLSMQELVALSPFTFPSDASRMFVGRKESKLVGVDLRTGRLVGVFGSGSGWCEWDEAREGRVKTEEECDEEISRRPEDLLYMARTGESIESYSSR